MTKIEWHPCVSIIDSIELFALQIVYYVMFNNGILVLSCYLSSCSLDVDTVAESENVFESLVLQGVLIHVDETSFVGDASIYKFFLGFAGWVDNARHEILLKGFTGINVSECNNLFTNLILVDLDHFPTKVDINSSLLALLKNDLISIRELIDFLIGCPELNSSILSSSSLDLILSQEVLVIQSVEVGTFTLVGELWRVDEHVSICVVPTVIIISLNSLLVINSVNEDLVFASVLFKVF